MRKRVIYSFFASREANFLHLYLDRTYPFTHSFILVTCPGNTRREVKVHPGHWVHLRALTLPQAPIREGKG